MIRQDSVIIIISRGAENDGRENAGHKSAGYETSSEAANVYV